MTSWRRRRKRFADKILKHKTAVATGLICLAVGGGLGWLAGSHTACAEEGCKTNVDSIEAAGTWAGGLGTMAAVIIAAAALRSEERIREQEDGEQRDFEFQEASRVTIERPGGGTRQGDRLLGFSLVVKNRTYESSIFDLHVIVEGWGERMRDHELPKGQPETLSFGTPSTHPNLPMDLPKAEQPEFFDGVVANTTITFTLASKRWRRVGFGSPELIDAEQTVDGRKE